MTLSPKSENRPIDFGVMTNGQSVKLITLKAHGLTANVMTYGASLQSLFFDPYPHSLVLGFEELNGYLRHPNYYGANVGRFANRINLGCAKIDGSLYQISQNENNKHTLHGGADGTGVRNWQIVEYSTEHVILKDVLPDGHMGFPGKLDVLLTYRIIEGAILELEFTATTDKTTLCNFAHHSYFNLDGTKDILNHELQINADHYLPVDNDLIPTGEIIPVDGTPFDFRKFRAITWDNTSFNYDHNFCTNKTVGVPNAIAKLRSPASNIELEISSTENGLQIYDGAGINCQDSTGNPLFSQHAGIALEPQAWPDNPNHEDFKTSLLHPGETYSQITRFAFSHPKGGRS